MLYINGAKAPSPSGLKVEITEVGPEEVRAASGRLVADRIAVKRRVTLQWPCLTADELGDLLSAVGAEPFFEATCPDPETGGLRTSVFRSGARTTGVLRMRNGEAVWTDVSMVWTEK